jgi:hypothetical protein
MAARLIIEIDGSQHGTEPVKSRDEQRTRRLEQESYRVIRFWNNDLTKNLKGVLESIYAALYGSRDSDAFVLKHKRRPRSSRGHPTPGAPSVRLRASRRAMLRRPSPCRGGWEPVARSRTKPAPRNLTHLHQR